MAGSSKLTDVLQFLLPKGKGNPAGTAATATFNPTATGQFLSVPAYLDHIADILTHRQGEDSQQLIQEFMKFDPDVSAAANAYLTVANQKPKFLVYNQAGQLDPAGQDQLNSLMQFMTGRQDYTLGFQVNDSIYGIAEKMRYMILLRGAIGTELVVDKNFLPVEFRIVDPKSLKWKEIAAGQYKPSQIATGVPQPIDLDIPTFFMSWYRKDPTGIYSYSPFVSVINTVAARTQIVNDLYRIMQISGYPRIHIKVMEDVIRKSAPPACQADESLMKQYITDRFTEIKNKVQNLRPDEVFVTTDATEPGVMNADMPGMTINVDSVIEVLNGQNQAALKTMATLIGRGTQGVNTASVEAVIFAMNADSLNEPIAEMFGNLFTMMLRLQGFQGYVDVEFEKAELRPELELEPQRMLKQSRLLELLSLGIIDDNEFHLELFGRPKPDSIIELSGTNFQQPMSETGQPLTSADAASATSAKDPMGRSITPKGGKAAGGNAVSGVTRKKTQIARTPAKG